MKNIEPRVQRQRLVVEAHYQNHITKDQINSFLINLAQTLKMTIHPDIPQPIITSATGKSNPIHDGFEGVIFWLESGASIYVWEKLKFLTVDIYTCKSFEIKKAIDLISQFFQTTDLEYKEV